MKNRGFTLFIAITLTATLLLIAAGIVSLAVKQSLISVSGRESQHAFYAADTGIECALYWDIQNPSGRSAFSISTGSQISCNNQTSIVGGNSLSTFSFNFLPDPYCAVVTVTKSGGSGIPGLPASLTFNSSTTWVAPAGVTSVQVEAWGGGGSGSGSPSDEWGNHPGGGGGGGAYSKKNNVAVVPGNGYTVTVGRANGDTWFNTTGAVLAKGGSTTGTGGGGGGGSAASGVGDIKTSGNGGGDADCCTSGGGGGGANPNGGGGGWGAGYGENGGSGSAPGGGGGGGGTYAGEGGIGGAGASGRIVLSYTPYEESGGTTTIESRGYNTCDLSNPRRVERAVRAIY